MRQTEDCETEFWGQAHFKSTGLCTLFNTASSAAPRILLCSVDAGIELRTAATLALAVRRSNTWLDIVSDLARSHLCLASSQDLIHDSVRSHPCMWNVARMICHLNQRCSLVVIGVAIVQHPRKKESKPAIFLCFSANKISLTPKQVAHQFLTELKQFKIFSLKIPKKI